MRLLRVIYGLLESDRAWMEGKEDSTWHEIDGEVQLETSSGLIHVSWASEPTQYSMNYQSASHLLDGAGHATDASAWPIWRNCVGGTIELDYLDEEHQVLEVRGENGSVFLSSQEQGKWWSDVVHISKLKPKPGS